MKVFQRLQSWIRAMEDIDDSAGSELRRLRERVRLLEAEKAAPATGGKRDFR